MKLPLQISFHSIPSSPEIEDAIVEHAERLDEFAERLPRRCRRAPSASPAGQLVPGAD